MTSTTGRSITFILREIVGEVLYFPVWWYSQGLVLAWRRFIRQWLGIYDRVGLRYLIVNMGKPMYGDYSRSGKVISFFFRLLLVGWSLLALSVGGLVVFFIFVLWVISPLIVIGLFLRQFFPIELYG